MLGLVILTSKYEGEGKKPSILRSLTTKLMVLEEQGPSRLHILIVRRLGQNTGVKELIPTLKK